MSCPVSVLRCKYNIVFDLDEVLCIDTVGSGQAPFFKDRGLILDAICPHYIFPGAKELIAFLYRMDEIRVSFFSAGRDIRNEPLVHALLKSSLSKQEYEKIKEGVQIYSRQHTTEDTPAEKEDFSKCFGVYKQKKRKNLQSIPKNGESLEDTVLIDDDHTNILVGQIKNHLFVERTEARHFESLRTDPKDNVHIVNRIYYVAGLLFAAINKSKVENIFLSEALFRIQYKLKENQEKFHFREEILSEDLYYRLGLETLRAIKPDLQFTTRESYLASVGRPQTAEEVAYFEDLIRQKKEIDEVYLPR